MKVAEARVTRLRLGLEAHRPFPPGNPDSGPEAGTGATLTRNNDLNNQRLEFQLSYGLPAFGDRFTLTPELGLGFYDNGRDYRLGWSLTNRMVGSRLPSPST